MTGEDVCLAVAADFKRNKISYDVAAKKLGQSVQTVYNRIASKKYFPVSVAKRWSEVFGFNMMFLMTGEGGLRHNTKSMYDYFDNLEVLVLSVDYLMSFVEDKDVKTMWISMLESDFNSFREAEARLKDRTGTVARFPIELQKRLEFLKEYEFMN